MNDSAINYQQLLTDTLQKQIIILGSTITLAKARHVQGLHCTDDGKVTSIEGNPQEVSIKLLEQFRELSPLMAKKTMRPLLNAIISSYPKAAPAHEAIPTEEKTTEAKQISVNQETHEDQAKDSPNNEQHKEQLDG